MQSFNNEYEKTVNETMKSKQKIEKEILKIESNVTNKTDRDFAKETFLVQVKMLENTATNKTKQLAEQKLLQTEILYFEAYRAIQNVQIFSLEPVSKLFILEICQNFMTEYFRLLVTLSPRKTTSNDSRGKVCRLEKIDRQGNFRDKSTGSQANKTEKTACIENI